MLPDAKQNQTCTDKPAYHYVTFLTSPPLTRIRIRALGPSLVSLRVLLTRKESYEARVHGAVVDVGLALNSSEARDAGAAVAIDIVHTGSAVLETHVGTNVSQALHPTPLHSTQLWNTTQPVLRYSEHGTKTKLVFASFT